MKRELRREIRDFPREESRQWPHKDMVELFDVLRAIDRLEEQEVLSQDWIDRNKEPFHHFENNKVDYYVSTDFLQRLLVPKQELPVVPKHVANWIARYREDFDLYPALRRLEDNTSFGGRVYEWYRANTHDFVNAYLTGEYEVEKEQKYYVLVRDEEYGGLWFLSKKSSGDISIGVSRNYSEVDWDTLKLTEQEIKDYDSRYWAFSVKVEELEE